VLRRPIESAQYLSIRYTERLAEAGATGSVGSKGDSYDNALAETVNGLYKAELIIPKGPWRTVEEVELATARWVHFWNTRRLHSACGNVPPAEFEAAYIAESLAEQRGNVSRTARLLGVSRVALHKKIVAYGLR